jgi:small ligand-binding sensory domain FIST
VEAATHARDELAGEAPSLAVLLVQRPHTENAVDVLNAVQETVEPPALIGCVAQAIVAGRHEFEDDAAVAVWLASGLAAETFQLDFVRTGSGGLLTGYRFDRTAHDLHLLLPDPYTFPSSLLIEHLNTDLPGTTVVGGVVSGGLGPGDTRLFHNRDVLTSGVVGARLPGLHGVPIVSQGCRPIGRPYIVTGADGAWITELGGRPPLVRLREIVEEMPRDEQDLVSHGLQIGIVVDEHLAAPGQGDFMIRGLLGAEPSTGAIEMGEVVEVGATVQFQVRDAVGADKDLRLALERAAAQLPGRPVGALLFTCNGRGRRMFGVADHDASTIEDLLGGIPLAGFFAAGEIGPIAGRNALHGFTASMVLFIDDTA